MSKRERDERDKRVGPFAPPRPSGVERTDGPEPMAVANDNQKQKSRTPGLPADHVPRFSKPDAKGWVKPVLDDAWEEM